MEQEPTFSGIDVAKAGVDVAVRPTGKIWSITYDDAGVAGLVDQLQTLRPAAVLLEVTGGLEVPLASALVAGNAAGGSSQSPTGARFRQAHRTAGQDRCPVRSGVGPFRRGGAPTGATTTGRRCSGTERHDHPAQPGDDIAGIGDGPARPIRPVGVSQYPGLHRQAR